MLKFGNKEFRNLQEQVKKNMDDILFILQEEGVLNEFGIKVVGQEATSANMPTVEDYKEDNPDWSYGDAYAVGTADPYTLYILTRANGTHPNDYWFNIGRFPVAGPQGPQGPQGDVGPQGATGPSGANGLSAGFGTIVGTAETISYGSDATVQITTSGPDTAKNIQFTFGIPEGRPGEDGASEWGEITGSLENQTDLFTALQSKQNTLVSGTNIKTINSESVLGSGNIAVQPTLVSGTNIKTINNESILGSGNINIQGGSGNVNDVEVNGVSVVDQDGVAEIDLTGYVESSDLATVATSGSYNDLSNKPSIPSVSGTNDGTNWTSITINSDTYAIPQGGGTGTITDVEVNGVSVVTAGVAEVTVPTKTSDLNNDSGFITSSALSGYATESYVQGYHDSTKQDVISDLSTIRSGAELGATAVQPAAISDMATKTWVGQQGYLTGITSSDVTTALGYTPGTSNFSGAYADLTGKPTIPSKTSDLKNDSGFITSSALSNYVTTNTRQTISSAKTFTNAVSVDLTGDYGSLNIIGDVSQYKPSYISFADTDFSITLGLGSAPTADNEILLPDNSGTIALTSDIPSLTGYATESWVSQQGYLTSVAWGDVTGKPTFATVATSGSYNDLSNKPTIPVVDYPVTDVQVDGVSVVSNKVASITLPEISLSNTEYQSPDYELKGIEINGDTWNIPLSNYVPTSRTINSKPLSANVTLTASDVGAVASVTPTTETWTFTLSDGTTTTKTIVTAVTVA